VCGTDNVTYSNSCILDIAACKAKADGSVIETAYHGGCSKENGTEKCTAVCPEIYNPVCGTDEITYSNDCELEKADCKARADGTYIMRARKGECSDDW
jgi:hypothetical protein